jgi:hypothetical protein
VTASQLNRSHPAPNPGLVAALRRAHRGDRDGFAATVGTLSKPELGVLQHELGRWARAGRIRPDDAAVALFDIVQARRAPARR